MTTTPTRVRDNSETHVSGIPPEEGLGMSK